jgi:hypothetical protein
MGVIDNYFLPLACPTAAAFFLGGGIGLGRQRLKRFNHASHPFCSGCFGDIVSLFAQASYFMPSIVPAMTGTHHHHITPSFFPLRWGLANFLVWAGLEQ